MTDFADNIKRIVGVPRDEVKDKTLEEIGGIPRQRGIGVQSGSGGFDDVGGQVVGGDTTGKVATTNASKTEAGAGDSSPASGSDQSTLSKTLDAGVVDADDLIDGTDGPALTTMDPSAFDGISFDSGALTGINATDCATSKALNIRVDGLFRPPAPTYAADGVTAITPQWTDPDVGPELLGYESGFYWTCNTASAATAVTAAIAGGEVFDLAPTISDTTFNSFDSLTASAFTARYDYLDIPSGLTLQTTLTGARSACSGVTAYCPASPPTYSQWPDDDTISLTFQDAKFVTNSLDADATIEYTGQDTSHVNFCMDGGRTGTIEAGRDGGSIVYETDSPNGAPTGIIRYYGSDGSFSGAGDASAGTLEMFRPNS